MFQKFKAKFIAEKTDISKGLAKTGKQVSNLESCIENAISLASKLATAWDDSDYYQKRNLQFLLFPDGVLYNSKKEHYRTLKVNYIFEYVSLLARVSEDKKTGVQLLTLKTPVQWKSSNELSNHLMEFFKQIYTLKRLFKFCP